MPCYLIELEPVCSNFECKLVLKNGGDMNLIEEIEKEFKKEIPVVKPGDEVALHLKVVEAGK